MRDPAGSPIRTLFICQQNRRRSATAERVFGKDPTLDVRSAGTSSDALVQVNQRMLEWADLVFVMDGEQVEALGRLFPDHPALPDVICLNIQDAYHFLDPELVAILTERTKPYFDRARANPAAASERS